MERIPKPGEFYRHFKGKLYQVIAVAEHAETGEQLVIYQALYGTFRVYARPLSMFTGETDREKYPDISQKYRFEKTEPEQEDQDRKEEEERKEEEVRPEEDSPGKDTDALLLAFVETGDFGVKLDILSAMAEKIRQKDLDLLYEALDLPKVPGDIREQLRSIEQYLQMRRKFDGERLR